MIDAQAYKYTVNLLVYIHQKSKCMKPLKLSYYWV